jgi:hypothetical protein
VSLPMLNSLAAAINLGVFDSDIYPPSAFFIYQCLMQ